MKVQAAKELEVERMHQDPRIIADESETGFESPQYKACAHCQKPKPIGEFMRRTGKRSGPGSRRGACRDCRKQRRQETKPVPVLCPAAEPAAAVRPAAPKVKPGRKRRPEPPVILPEGPDAFMLSPTRLGIIQMRGKTDRGRRWQQETDMETAVTLVKEHAAVVVNRHTIRRLYSNKMFRQYVLTRDRYTCYFCGGYGDTIDHLLPRAKGGHSTPVNCVCACNLCNQSKADRSVDEFMESNSY